MSLVSLSAEVAEVLSYLGDAPATLRCHPALEPAVRKIVEGRPEISVVADPALGPGLWAEAADGSLAVDGTLAGRLRRLRPALSLDVLRDLEEAP